MGALDGLLVVQRHDTAADQLRHRRDALPERTQLDEVSRQVAGVDREAAGAEAQRDDVSRRQQRLEDELASLEEKRAQLDKRMYSGEVTVPRELQAMQADADSLRRRQSDLEDRVLETMEEREPLDADLARLDEHRRELDERAEGLRGAIAEAEVRIDGELADEESARAEAAAPLPDDLLERYETLRAKLGGIGAAELVRGSCTGCHLALPATAVDRIRREPPDTVVLCDQCGRILVRRA